MSLLLALPEIKAIKLRQCHFNQSRWRRTGFKNCHYTLTVSIDTHPTRTHTHIQPCWWPSSHTHFYTLPSHTPQTVPDIPFHIHTLHIDLLNHTHTTLHKPDRVLRGVEVERCVYHSSGLVQIITGQELQWASGNQSFGIIHSGSWNITEWGWRNPDLLESSLVLFYIAQISVSGLEGGRAWKG